MKPALIAAAIGLALTALIAVGASGLWQMHDAHADERYVKQETFRDSVNQQRIWDLQDRQQIILDKGKLTTADKEDIKRLNKQIEDLQGR